MNINTSNNKLFTYIGLGVISYSVGVGSGYLIAKKYLSQRFFPEVDETPTNENPIDENQLSLFDEDLEVIVVENILDKQNDNIEWFGEETKTSPEEPIVINVFKSNDDQWDYEAELAIRSSDAPYVIHRDEYIQDEMSFDQTTVTYYVGDDIMCDQKDVPMYGYSSFTGPLKFGHGSGDPDIVYIRNEKLQTEWEVLLHTGSYEIEVLGHDFESRYSKENIAHSLLKFRDE